jgi:hypothetical protein
MKELNVFCFAINLAITVLLGVLLPIVPTLTRKSLLFGVKVPPEQSESGEARALKRRCIAVCIVGSVAILGLAIAQFAAFPDLTLLGSMYFPLLFFAVQLAAFIPNHSAAIAFERGSPLGSFNDNLCGNKNIVHAGLPFFNAVGLVYRGNNHKRCKRDCSPCGLPINARRNRNSLRHQYDGRRLVWQISWTRADDADFQRGHDGFHVACRGCN